MTHADALELIRLAKDGCLLLVLVVVYLFLIMILTAYRCGGSK